MSRKFEVYAFADYSEQDKANTLVKWFNPNLDDDELRLAGLEGWILGVLSTQAM